MKFLLIVHIFNRQIWIKSDAGDVRRHLLGDCEFRENRRTESFILLRATNECLFAFFTFIIRFAWDLV